MIHRKGRLALSTTDRFRLHPRAQLVPVHSLGTSGLGLPGEPDDVIVGVAGARSASLLVSAELGQLLELFRKPNTLPEALESLARARGLEVHALLEDAWPALQEVRRHGILEPASEAPEPAPGPLFDAGETPIDGVTVTAAVHHVEDSEIFAVTLADGRRGALKI
ncbi:MAG: hypothetical protein AAFY88_15445, partial [Acidobacteriota bacterium]